MVCYANLDNTDKFIKMKKKNNLQWQRSWLLRDHDSILVHWGP